MGCKLPLLRSERISLMLRAVAQLWDRTSPKDVRHYDPKARAYISVRTYVTRTYNVAFKLDQKLPSIFYERFISTDFTTRHHITRATSRLYNTVRAASIAAVLRGPPRPIIQPSSPVVHPLCDSIEKIPRSYGKRFIFLRKSAERRDRVYTVALIIKYVSR